MKICANTAQTLESLPEYFRVKDIHALFHVDPSTIYRVLERQELPVIRFGKGIVIEKKSLLEWVARKKAQSLTRAQL